MSPDFLPWRRNVDFLDCAETPIRPLIRPLIFALVGYWGVGLGIGAWLAFGRDWQGVGIWIGLASGLAAVAVLMIGRWLARQVGPMTPVWVTLGGSMRVSFAFTETHADISLSD